MTFFEQELRKIVGDICPKATYVGRACYIELSEQNRAKIFFNDLSIRDHYDALQVTILNKNKGEVDRLMLRFEDILGIKQVNNRSRGISPYAWSYNRETEWYGYKPNAEDYKQLQNSLLDYLKVYGYEIPRKLSLAEQIALASEKGKGPGGDGGRNGPGGPDPHPNPGPKHEK